MADKKVFILESTLINIGNSIRNKKGTTAKINPLDIPNEIDSIRSISEMVLQEKTVAPGTTAKTVVPDSGYDGLAQVNVSAMPVVAQATPSVSINASGLITASSTQTEGYVKSGTKSGVKQLTVQDAKTITPSSSSQTAVAKGVYTTGVITVGAIPSSYVKPSRTYSAKTYTPGTTNQTIASGTYCSGTQTIKGDANLKAENIKSGVSIFDVTGSYEGSGGGGAQGATVTISIPRSPMAPPAPPSASISYTSPSLTVESISLSGYGSATTITVAIGTIISITATIAEMWSRSGITGGIETILDIGKMGQAYYAFKVTDTNGTIDLHL